MIYDIYIYYSNILTIQNDIDMRNKTAENKLLSIGKKYHQKMWTHVSSPQNTVTPMKKTFSETRTQRNSMLQNVNRPRQLQNKISRCLNFNKENQLNEKSECNDISTIGDLQNDLEDVLYSEGEGVTDLYPNNTWDPEDDIGDDDYSLISGWS